MKEPTFKHHVAFRSVDIEAMNKRLFDELTAMLKNSRTVIRLQNNDGSVEVYPHGALDNLTDHETERG